MRPHSGPQSRDHWTCAVDAASQFPSDASRCLLSRRPGESPLTPGLGPCSHLLGGSQQWGRDIPVLRSCLCQTLRTCCTVIGWGSFHFTEEDPDSQGTRHLLGSDKTGVHTQVCLVYGSCASYSCLSSSDPGDRLSPLGQSLDSRLQLRSKRFQLGRQVQCA